MPAVVYYSHRSREGSYHYNPRSREGSFKKMKCKCTLYTGKTALNTCPNNDGSQIDPFWGETNKQMKYLDG